MAAGSVAFLCGALCAAAAATEPAALPSPPAPAPPPLHQRDAGERRAAPELRLGAAFALTDFGYKEFGDGGELLDREDGVVPGVALGATLRRGRFEIAAELGYSRGAADYDGTTNTGIPVTTTTAEEVVSGALRLRPPFLGGVLAPYLGLGYYRWDRDIRSTFTPGGARVAGLFERYRWWTGELGAAIRVLSRGRLRGFLDARVFRTMGSEVEVDFSSGLDDVTLRLGDRTGYRLGALAAWAVTGSSELSLEVFHERWDFGRSRDAALTSAGVPVGNVHEPRSETRNIGLTLGITSRIL